MARMLLKLPDYNVHVNFYTKITDTLKIIKYAFLLKQQNVNTRLYIYVSSYAIYTVKLYSNTNYIRYKTRILKSNITIIYY